MPIEIIRNDITTMHVDAIVNAANSSLLGGGGVDGMIHRAAGPELLAECRTLGGCPTGEARITGGYRLPCRYVIHTVGPVWQGGQAGEERLLRSCYRRSLELAHLRGCQSVAFPLIAAGSYGYPRGQALRVAMDEISRFLKQHEMTVYVVVFDRKTFAISESLYASIAQYIDDHYVDAYAMHRNRRDDIFLQEAYNAPEDPFPTGSYRPVPPSMAGDAMCQPYASASWDDLSLSDWVNELDESFTEMLLRLIDERGMKDSECYKRANVDRKLFSKIRSNPHYQPTKRTALAFAIALKLSLDETRALLEKAGFALSHATVFDVIIEYFIVHKRYNIHEINEALFEFDQQRLGA